MSDELHSNSSDKKKSPRQRRAARKHQITQVTDLGTSTGLHFITLYLFKKQKKVE